MPTTPEPHELEPVCVEARYQWCSVHEAPWPAGEPICERARAELADDEDEGPLGP